MSAPDPTARTLFAGRPLAPSRPARGEHPFVFTSDWPHDGLTARTRTMAADRDGLEIARACIAATLEDKPPGVDLHRALWRWLRGAFRGCDRGRLDRLAWRARCHRTNGRTEVVVWPGGRATRHTVHLAERRRCLLMGRAHPIAGPVGRLP